VRPTRAGKCLGAIRHAINASKVCAARKFPGIRRWPNERIVEMPATWRNAVPTQIQNASAGVVASRPASSADVMASSPAETANVRTSAAINIESANVASFRSTAH
jgi:hypothetical protein